ncbi:hypothetical protein SARC_02502 [Sphaeroforma arctica JP610]|uniref:Acyl carrier protein n=1 Tax=Sphaeroforma arctica JP610 TaxID=667725 RepID=A0A0L0G8J0_9EUKA|nr:hypothetical protein SARC_02502 [Sphaeroforma arctica JP610]KNC85320.1 hypothetical protein SARC_02502 [Sphaeroforma arctica JP610]|eukprot:XP_014159222.1 hypothetical protein SARC_02502 [Sphaeroforma arctica JP610]
MSFIVAAFRPAARSMAAAYMTRTGAVFATQKTGLVSTRGYAAAGLTREDAEKRVFHVLQNFDKVDASKVSTGAHFINDLGLDSLDVVEVVIAFEEEFAMKIPDAEAEKIFTADDAINYVLAHES